jgi:hypothetical protein
LSFMPKIVMKKIRIILMIVAKKSLTLLTIEGFPVATLTIAKVFPPSRFYSNKNLKLYYIRNVFLKNYVIGVREIFKSLVDCVSGSILHFQIEV